MYTSSRINQPATQAERRPIMTSPIELPTRNRGDVMDASDQSKPGIDHRSTNYNAIQPRPLNASALRDTDGGYLGPAAEEGRYPPRPHAHESALHRPQNGHLASNRDGLDTGADNDGLMGCCRRRTPCEKRLAGAILLLGCVLAALGGLLYSGPSWLQYKGAPCDTKECIRAAGDIMDGLDEDVDPCQDFAGFACGGWYREHPIPSGEMRWALFDTLEEQTLYDIKGLLEQEIHENETLPVKAAKTVFLACVNSSAWSELGLRPLNDLLAKEGGYPMLDPAWNDTTFDLVTSLARMRSLYGGMGLVAVTVDEDSMNTSISVITLGQGLLQLRREAFLEQNSTANRDKYVAYIQATGAELLLDLGREDDAAVATLMQDSSDMWDLCVTLAQITLPDENLTNPWTLYNPMTITELQQMSDEAAPEFKFDWFRFLRETFEDAGVELTGEQRVIVEVPQYVTQLMNVLKNTPKRVLANYLLSQLVQGMADEVLTGDNHLQLRQKDTKSFGRRSGRAWYDCADKTNKILDMAVGYMYVNNFVEDNVASEVQEVVDDIKGTVKSLLTGASWMGSAREEALRKLDNMKTLVAYPDTISNASRFLEYHFDLPEVFPARHFDNMISLSNWHSKRSLRRLKYPSLREGWIRGPVETNAFYSSSQNSILIPVAVLQPPVFRREPLTALNYGALGVVIGHEITHGFDNYGRERDHNGNLNEWWTSATDAEYSSRSKCFADQYENFDVSQILAPYERDGEEMKINGIASKGENIADNGGTKAAWLAYKRRVKKTRENLQLPGLEVYTQDQLFFISFGQLWCSKFTAWALKYALSTDVHIPGAFRIMGILQNLQEFSDTFQCPRNSTLNPEKKCVLW